MKVRVILTAVLVAGVISTGNGFGITEQNVANVQASETIDDFRNDRILIWHDEFDGTELNPEYWTIADGWNRNNELHVYDPGCVKVSNGIAKITAKRVKKAKNNYEWVSGEFEAINKVAFQNFRMEAKIRMNTSKGFCPAFWTLGETISGWNWPMCGEIDIFELPYEGTVSTNTHASNAMKQHVAFGGNGKGGYNFNTWHVYALELKDGIYTISVDNEVISVVDTNANQYYDGVNPFLQPQYPIFNIAVGGTASAGKPADGVNSATMEIDWVRVYAAENKVENIVPTKFEMKYLGTQGRFVNGCMKVGDTAQLFPVYFPSGTVKRGIVSCVVADENICKCSAGYISALSAGTTSIAFLDSNGLTDTITVKVVEPSVNNVTGVNIENVNLSRKDIWLSGFYGYNYPYDLKADKARVHTNGLANIKGNQEYIIACPNGTAMHLTIFDKNGQIIQSSPRADSNGVTFRTNQNAAFAKVNITIPDGAVNAKDYSRILEVLPNYKFSIKRAN